MRQLAIGLLLAALPLAGCQKSVEGTYNLENGPIAGVVTTFGPHQSAMSSGAGGTYERQGDTLILTYRQFIDLAAELFGTAPRYRVLKRWQLRLAGLFNSTARDAAELLPRYAADNIFVSDKFKTRFPEFRVKTIREGLTTIKREAVSGVA